MKNPHSPSDRLQYLLDGVEGAARITGTPAEHLLSWVALGLEMAQQDPAGAKALRDEIAELYAGAENRAFVEGNKIQAAAVLSRAGRRLT